MATVLIVEDSPLQMMLLEGLPALQEHTVRATETIADAVAACEGVDLLLLDAQLPDGDFQQAHDALRAAGCHAPIIAMTARPDSVGLEVMALVDKSTGTAALTDAIHQWQAALTA